MAELIDMPFGMSSTGGDDPVDLDSPSWLVLYRIHQELQQLDIDLDNVNEFAANRSWAEERFCSRGGPRANDKMCKYTKYTLYTRGLGRSPSRQTIWCILALKFDIWWQQF